MEILQNNKGELKMSKKKLEAVLNQLEVSLIHIQTELESAKNGIARNKDNRYNTVFYDGYLSGLMASKRLYELDIKFIKDLLNE